MAVPDNLRLMIAAIDRDKLLRFTQFYAKFHVWTNSRIWKGETAAQLETWKLLIKQITLVRRLSRLGKNVSYFQEAAQQLLVRKADQEDPIIRCAAIGHKLGLAGYLTYDAAVALHVLGLSRLKSLSLNRVQKRSSLWWAFSIACNITICLRSLKTLRLQAQIEKAADLAPQYQLISRKAKNLTVSGRSRKRNSYQLQVKLFALLCDMVIALAPLEISHPSDGIIGLCGMSSSIINVWISMEQGQPGLSNHHGLTS
ncbi:unnamed protein product [Clonostachys rosea]|uniref:Peroxisomal biogenesis factor 11 n=1 Tax=Bionectria ochroleuca TaxID=29856 RepID=A0ABY6TX87_BIOOC|nr:unnamed protein product [Clonostachys rosea]